MLQQPGLLSMRIGDNFIQENGIVSFQIICDYDITKHSQMLEKKDDLLYILHLPSSLELPFLKITSNSPSTSFTPHLSPPLPSPIRNELDEDDIEIKKRKKTSVDPNVNKIVTVSDNEQVKKRRKSRLQKSKQQQYHSDNDSIYQNESGEDWIAVEDEDDNDNDIEDKKEAYVPYNGILSQFRPNIAPIRVPAKNHLRIPYFASKKSKKTSFNEQDFNWNDKMDRPFREAQKILFPIQQILFLNSLENSLFHYRIEDSTADTSLHGIKCCILDNGEVIFKEDDDLFAVCVWDDIQKQNVYIPAIVHMKSKLKLDLHWLMTDKSTRPLIAMDYNFISNDLLCEENIPMPRSLETTLEEMMDQHSRCSGNFPLTSETKMVRMSHLTQKQIMESNLRHYWSNISKIINGSSQLHHLHSYENLLILYFVSPAYIWETVLGTYLLELYLLPFVEFGGNRSEKQIRYVKNLLNDLLHCDHIEYSNILSSEKSRCEACNLPRKVIVSNLKIFGKCIHDSNIQTGSCCRERIIYLWKVIQNLHKFREKKNPPTPDMVDEFFDSFEACKLEYEKLKK